MCELMRSVNRCLDGQVKLRHTVHAHRVTLGTDPTIGRVPDKNQPNKSRMVFLFQETKQTIRVDVVAVYRQDGGRVDATT